MNDVASHLYGTKRATTTFVLTENYDVVRCSCSLFGGCQVSVLLLFKVVNSCQVEGWKNLEFSLFYERVLVEEMCSCFSIPQMSSRLCAGLVFISHRGKYDQYCMGQFARVGGCAIAK